MIFPVTLRKVLIDEIVIESSPYNFRAALVNEPSEPWDERLPLLPPVLLLDSSDKLHLIDGLRRLRFLKERAHKATEALVVEPEDPTEAVRYIFALHRKKVLQSTMQRVLFLSFALSLGASLEEVSELVRLKGHRDLAEEVQRVSALPEDLKRFFHEKNFSYLQILTFLVYPSEMLETVINWKDRLTLTAQIFEELVANLAEYLQRQGRSLEEFLQDEKLNEILASDEPPKRRTEALRQYIRQLRFPYLEGINRAVRERIEGLSLPPNIQVLWDRTIEEPWVEFRIKVTDATDLDILTEKEFLEEVSKRLKEVYDIIKHGSSKK